MENVWAGLNRVSRNLWWGWDAGATRLFRQLDPQVWRTSKASAVAVLQTLGSEETLKRLTEQDLHEEAKRTVQRFDDYMAKQPTWPGATGPAAYFSAEFGIHESLPIYAGGLGILAGDHCKSASDLAVPFVAVGLLYKEGYFTQLIDGEGRQRAYYRRDDFDRMALEPICDDSGRVQILSIPGVEGDLQFAIWRAQVGRVTLYLMDTAVAPNRAANRALTQRLYGGDTTVRIRQEILLGIGGVRTLRHLGIEPSVYHMNEGHTAFLTLELIRARMADGESFEMAQRNVRDCCVFTTHTPVPAGHDRFDAEMMERELGWLREELGLDSGAFMGSGRVNPHDSNELFCMTVLALRNARAANGVSALHGEVSRTMWADLWPDKDPKDTPIGHITNGVHIPTWIASEMADLLDSHLGGDWRERSWDEAVWDGVDNIPDAVLWAVHCSLKKRLLEFAWRQTMARRLRVQRPGRLRGLELFDTDALTIGFARRFATYKRGDLLFRDMDRARSLLANPQRPVQILFAGKAHPHDWGGGSVLQRVVLAGRDDELSHHVVFLEDYGINVAQYLVQGVDLWLNTPRRPREASGTSGQKVPLNGGINASTIDGWWCEGYAGDNGWNIGDTRAFGSQEEQDNADYHSLMNVLENEVIPAYYERDPNGVPRKWVKIMKASLKSVAPRFNSNRMVRDYAQGSYWPDGSM